MKNEPARKYSREVIDEEVQDCHETLFRLCKQEDRDEERIKGYLSFVTLNLICSMDDSMESWVDRFGQFKDKHSETTT
jgi:hypothetical protein